MSILIFCIIVLIVVALAVYAISLLPIPQPPIKGIIQALIVLIGVLVICQRAGLLGS